jgi:hypothetical protein
MAGKSKAARALAKRLAHEQLEQLAGGTEKGQPVPRAYISYRSS